MIGRTDEQEQEIKCLEESYEQEIEVLLKEAVEKIEEYRKKLDFHERGATARELESLKKRYEEERNATESKFNLFKQRTLDAEKQLSQSMQEKVSALQADVEESKAVFISRTEALSKTLQTQEIAHGKTLDELKSLHRVAIEQLQAKYEEKLRIQISNHTSVQDLLSGKIGALQVHFISCFSFYKLIIHVGRGKSYSNQVKR